jgi:hypothetical protein
MLHLYVECAQGHYRPPGNVNNLTTATTYDVAPPSTVRGFVSSAAGIERSGFQGSVAYGLLNIPGRGTLLRRASVFHSSKMDSRMQLVETLFNVRYIIHIDTDAKTEQSLRDTIAGCNQKRYGLLYLGESTDLVTVLREARDEDLEGARWVVPSERGQGMCLPVKTTWGYDNINPMLGWFDFGNEPYFHKFEGPGR